MKNLDYKVLEELKENYKIVLAFYEKANTHSIFNLVKNNALSYTEIENMKKEQLLFSLIISYYKKRIKKITKKQSKILRQ